MEADLVESELGFRIDRVEVLNLLEHDLVFDCSEVEWVTQYCVLLEQLENDFERSLDCRVELLEFGEGVVGLLLRIGRL